MLIVINCSQEIEIELISAWLSFFNPILMIYISAMNLLHTVVIYFARSRIGLLNCEIVFYSRFHNLLLHTSLKNSSNYTVFITFIIIFQTLKLRSSLYSK